MYWTEGKYCGLYESCCLKRALQLIIGDLEKEGKYWYKEGKSL
jgi:hypothetical protein